MTENEEMIKGKAEWKVMKYARQIEKWQPGVKENKEMTNNVDMSK